MSEWKEFSAKTVDEALNLALAELETTRENVEYEVIETADAVKGNTTNNAQKDAVIETGYTVKVPLFISQGEKIIISTSDGKYAGRA